MGRGIQSLTLCRVLTIGYYVKLWTLQLFSLYVCFSANIPDQLCAWFSRRSHVLFRFCHLLPGCNRNSGRREHFGRSPWRPASNTEGHNSLHSQHYCYILGSSVDGWVVCGKRRAGTCLRLCRQWHVVVRKFDVCPEHEHSQFDLSVY